LRGSARQDILVSGLLMLALPIGRPLETALLVSTPVNLFLFLAIGLGERNLARTLRNSASEPVAANEDEKEE
jgi:hypothetical protein